MAAPIFSSGAIPWILEADVAFLHIHHRQLWSRCTYAYCLGLDDLRGERPFALSVCGLCRHSCIRMMVLTIMRTCVSQNLIPYEVCSIPHKAVTFRSGFANEPWTASIQNVSLDLEPRSSLRLTNGLFVWCQNIWIHTI